MNIYYKIKIFMDYILPFALFTVIILVIVICSTVSAIKENRIHKFFVSNGYERKLFGVPSFGDGAFYGWVRESDHKRVDDRDIRGWSLKRIKEKYK